ncbi:alpha/beta hydrolase [Solirubrobacter taibaiensis]|nr:alpha/beta hydrolase [Solirubrobacter taibaiensis]
MPTVTLPQGTIHYTEDGPPEGRVALFVHGALVAGDLWGEVARALAERGWRCLVPTWPLGCHTEAMRPDADLSPPGQAEIIHAFVTALGLRDVTLVGNDSGGALCQLAIDQDPAPFSALVLTNCDAFDVFPPKAFRFLLTLGRRPRLMRAAFAGMRFDLIRRTLGYGVLVRRRLPRAMTAGWWAPWLTDPAIRHDVARFLGTVDPAALEPVSRRMSTFDRPVTLCWAVEDRFFTERLGRRLEATFPQARFVAVQDARTFVMWDQPQAVVAALHDLDRVHELA